MTKRYFGHFEYLKGLLTIDRTLTCTNINLFKHPVFKQEENKAKIITHIFGFKVHTIKLRHFTSIPTKEIFYQQFCADESFCRLDLIVNLLAIENEQGLNDFGWDIYTKMQSILYGKEQAELQKSELKTLIAGGKNALTLPESPLVITTDLKIVDNIRQLALSLFHKEKNIAVEVLKKTNKKRHPISVDRLFFIYQNFSISEIEAIDNCFSRLKEYIGPYRITGFLWPPAIKLFDEITNRISEFYKVVSYKDILFDESSFYTFVKALYRCDDIADWKIDKKNEFMHDFFPKKIRVLTLEVAHPYFRFKNDKLRFTVLDHIVRLKGAFRNNYKDKIENYQVDIILHSADNTNESEFMGDIVNSEFKMVEMLREISEPGVFTIGIQSTDQECLQKFPFCKDMAIICKKELFSDISLKIKYFLEKNLQGLYTFTFESEENKCTYHIRYKNNIVYKFSIQTSLKNIDNQSLENSFSSPEKWNGINVPTMKDDDIYKKVLFHQG
ncbi:MAG: hypothetical protein MJ250_06220 [Alphaproteobacteria bacterium]|nr:hypothetical protein [Alphaproteobacteria bacterium]